MTWLCPRPCENKTADGYCGTSWCINPMYSNIGTANEKLMGGLRKTTNADRIRAMTDEELAEWITELTDCTVYPHTRKDAPCVSIGQTCAASWLDWLKQEANDAT